MFAIRICGTIKIPYKHSGIFSWWVILLIFLKCRPKICCWIWKENSWVQQFMGSTNCHLDYDWRCIFKSRVVSFSRHLEIYSSGELTPLLSQPYLLNFADFCLFVKLRFLKNWRMSWHLSIFLWKTILWPGILLSLPYPHQFNLPQTFQSGNFWYDLVGLLLCRFYTSLLHCLHLVIMDPKGPLSDYVSSESRSLRHVLLCGLGSTINW